MRKIAVILLLLISHFVSGQTFILNASVTYTPPPTPPTTGVRTLIYDDFSGSSLNSRWNVRRSDKQTITVSGGSARVSVNTDTIAQRPGYAFSNITTQTMIYDTSYQLTCIRNYVIETGFRINKLNDTTLGAYTGAYSPFTAYPFSNFGHFQFSGPDTIRILGGVDTAFTFPPSGQSETSTVPVNTTDYYVIRHKIDENTDSLWFVNRTTLDSVLKVVTFQFTSGGWLTRPSYFWFAFGAMGRSDVSFDYYLVTTTEELNPAYLFVGNSITTGYNATTADSAYANILKRATTDSVQIYAGGGMGVDEILLAMHNLVAINPQYVFLNIGTNNTYNSPNSVKYQTIVDSFTNRGFTVFPCLIVNGGDPTSGGGWNQWIKTTYASSYIDLWTAGWNTMTIGNGEMYDGVHPTLSGHQKLAALIQTLKPLLFPTNLGYASCPNVLDIPTLTNFTENSTGTYTVTSAASDGNGKASQTITGDGYVYSEYQSSQNTESLAIVWDSLSTLTTSYYTTGKFTFFVFAGGYWANYDQEGAINTGIAAVDGDLFGLKRTGSTITARYYRSGTWTTARTFAGSHSTTLYQYISSANDGSTAWKILNLKYCNE